MLHKGAAACPVFAAGDCRAQLRLSAPAQHVPCAGLCTGLGQSETVTRSGPGGAE